MSLALCIIGFILIVAGVVGYGYYFKNKFYNFKENFSPYLLKKNCLYLLVPALSFLIGFVLVTTRYYTNPYILSYFESNSITVTSLSYFMIYFGEILFVLFLITFLSCLFFRMYLSRKNKKFDKILRIIQYVSIVACVGFFLMYMEGQAPYLIYPLANVIVFCKNGVVMINTNSTSGKAYLSNLGDSFHFQIALYAIFIISGACLVFYICDHKLYKEYGHHGLITTCFFIAFPCGILGARAWYVIGNWTRDGFNLDPSKIFRIWEGGLAIMGGAVFGIIAGITVMIIYKIVNSRYKPIDYLLLVDIIVPTILVAQAIGRFGNFFNNEVHGEAFNVSYFGWLPSFIKNNMHYSSTCKTLDSSEIYLPLFFIEGVVNLCGYFFIEYGLMNLFGLKYKLNHDYHPGGSCVGWYIAWYGATRAVLEPLRNHNYNMGENDKFSNVSAYYMIGIGMFIVICCIVLKILNEKGIIKYQWQKYNEQLKEEGEIE